MKKSILAIIISAMLVLLLCGCSEQSTKEFESWRVGEYRGEYIGLALEQEDSDNPIVRLQFVFTNDSTEAISFQEALSPAVYQAGSELIRIDDDLIDASSIAIGPGESHTVYMSYYLLDRNELLEIVMTNHKTGEQFSGKCHCEK